MAPQRGNFCFLEKSRTVSRRGYYNNLNININKRRDDRGDSDEVDELTGFHVGRSYAIFVRRKVMCCVKW